LLGIIMEKKYFFFKKKEKNRIGIMIVIMLMVGVSWAESRPFPSLIDK